MEFTEVEDKRLLRRAKVFQDEGLPEEEALDLAYRMLLRDRDKTDNRRVCFECGHLVNRLCVRIRDKSGKPTQQLRFILQRCDYFQLKGKSHG